MLQLFFGGLAAANGITLLCALYIGAVSGGLISAILLNMPGTPASAMLLGSFMIHGLQPGPLLSTTHADLVYTIFGAMFIPAVVMLIVQLVGLRLFANVLKVPKNYLLPVLVVLCLVGAYSLNNRTFDVWRVLIFGAAGYILVKLEMPLPPLILGFVLGENTELYLRRGPMYTHGSFPAFFKSPVAAIFLTASMISIVLMV